MDSHVLSSTERMQWHARTSFVSRTERCSGYSRMRAAYPSCEHAYVDSCVLSATTCSPLRCFKISHACVHAYGYDFRVHCKSYAKDEAHGTT